MRAKCVRRQFKDHVGHKNDDSEQKSEATVSAKRGANFTAAEDVQIARSWANVSQDAENLEFGDNIRPPGAIRQRYGIINKDVSKFVGILAAVEDLEISGTNKDDDFRNACKVFKEEQKKDFKFRACWEILKDVPKFKLSIQSKKAAPSADPASDQEQEDPSTPGKGRPIGTKAAKLKAATARDQAKVASEKLKVKQESLAAVHTKNRLMDEFNENKILTLRMADLDEDAQAVIRAKRQKILSKYQNPPSPAAGRLPRIEIPTPAAPSEIDSCDSDSE
ncbi:hypothetical protein HDU98_003579 [Podochytrium sp. JEL0797]|nr:hypothetical protein HDU98_003579 [Podochytrium sp. JEL0797]